MGDNNPDHDEVPEQADTESEVPDVSLSLNAMLELLSHHHRREILRHLINDPDHTATISDLATKLVSHQAERAGRRPARDEIEMQIHHVHLPKLAEAGVVEYDARSQELRYWRHERLEDYLEFLQPDEPCTVKP